MNSNPKSKPRIPRVQQFSNFSSVGVLKPCCTTTSERTGRWAKMPRSLARFSGPESLIHTRSLADFITTTSGFRFSVHTRKCGGETIRHCKLKHANARTNAKKNSPRRPNPPASPFQFERECFDVNPRFCVKARTSSAQDQPPSSYRTSKCAIRSSALPADHTTRTKVVAMQAKERLIKINAGGRGSVIV